MAINNNNAWSVWIAGTLAAIVIAACGLYGKWINDSITDHEQVIRDVLIKLEGIDTKLNIELEEHHIKIPNK